MLPHLEVPNTPCNSISMDFFVSLPESEAYTRIAFIVERFTKITYFIPLKTEATIKELSLESKFWYSLMKLLGVNLCLSTAYRPQADGQTERVNQMLEQYLRNYCSYQQDNWAGLLPLAEYAYNTATQQSTKVSQSYANYGFEPDSNWNSRRRKLDNVNVSSATRQKKWYDQKHMKAPEPEDGDKVMMDRRNMVANTPSSKLDYKTLCLFEVDEKLVVAFYRLKLPSQWNIHYDFQIFLLESYRGLKYPQSTEVTPTPDEVEGEYSHVLQEIANSRWQQAGH
ncbi:uncharacterized protein H6S33_001449 [Morchella sextelata]|uniref:uncharacterized protein n=1 Tax=Morchella sextelata TaxID=1174677 RepID=UPI001D053CAB|nr:uncharacterized protein H6S33_001449 [Morchella sextelata]KAH0609221.1 hypothetical protein H6S33_001449 [Morchella sextelata]